MKRMTMMPLMKTTAVLGILTLSMGSVFAADYYVAPNGADTNPGSVTKPWKTISKANVTLRPGDTVNIVAGEYRERIEPASSGTRGNYITYRAVAGQQPVITAPPGRLAMRLQNKDYIHIDGLHFDGKKPYTQSNIATWASLENADYNIIENSTFKNAQGWAGVAMKDSDYNQILNNKLDQVGAFFDPRTKEGMGNMFDMHCADHNLVQGNIMTRGGHTLMAINGSLNVVRGNVFDNQWGEGQGYKAIELMHRNSVCKSAVDHNVFERNVVKNALPRSAGFRGNGAPQPSPGMILDGQGQIVRYNLFVNNSEAAIHSAYRPPVLSGIRGMRIYNNTFYKNGGVWQVWDYGNGGSIADNIFQNNIIAASTGEQIVARLTAAGRAPIEDTVFAANAFSGDATFDLGKGKRSLTEMLSMANFKNSVLTGPDFLSTDPVNAQAFRLKAGSAMIDAGHVLTTTTAVGKGRTVSVVDAGWFSDGMGITGGDLLRIGGNAPVRVTSVNYSNNTLFLESTIAWNKGAGVSVSYQGAAPDIGAYEYANGPSKTLPAPLSLEITKQ